MPLNDPPKDPKKKPEMTKGTLAMRFAAAALVVVLGNAAINSYFSEDVDPKKEEITYSTFLEKIEGRQVKKVTSDYDDDGRPLLRGQTADDKPFHVYPMTDATLVNKMKEAKVEFEQAPQPVPSTAAMLLRSLAPIALLIGAYFYMMNRQMGGSGGIFSMGKSKAKLLTEDQKTVTFKDVAGIEEAKDGMMEIVKYLKDPSPFTAIGGRAPRGVLLTGGPGTGKTLLARAVAGEAGVPFFSISGSDFVEMFVGVGASRVRDMFEQAKAAAPCILFIDEIDAIGRQRSSGHGLGGGHDEREQTLNQILVEMDGFEGNSGVIVMAATNRPDVLDKALLRPGRFDREVVVPTPDINGRVQILEVHMRKVVLAPDIDARVIASGTTGFSGAELANLVNEAALVAVRRGGKEVNMLDFESAKHRIQMGAERKLVMSEEGRRLTARHEAGHAIVGIYTKNDPVTMVSIVPRGRALGVTLQEPNEDRYSMNQQEMEDRIAMFHAGRIAEIDLAGSKGVTSGASNDIERATEIARAMVTQFGMSEKLGVVHYHAANKGTGMERIHAPAIEELIDLEVKRIMDEGEQKAKEIIEAHKQEFLNLSDALEKYETLTGEEIRQAMRGEEIKTRMPVIRNANDNQASPKQAAKSAAVSQMRFG